VSHLKDPRFKTASSNVLTPTLIFLYSFGPTAEYSRTPPVMSKPFLCIYSFLVNSSFSNSILHLLSINIQLFALYNHKKLNFLLYKEFLLNVNHVKHRIYVFDYHYIAIDIIHVFHQIYYWLHNAISLDIQLKNQYYYHHQI
jgi:hypothetical protein